MKLFTIQHSDCHTETVDGGQNTPNHKGKTRGITYLIASIATIINCAFAQLSTFKHNHNVRTTVPVFPVVPPANVLINARPRFPRW